MVENYSRSIEIKKQQLESLEAAVEVANNLFQNARTEYLDVLLAQRDLRDARVALIDTKAEQLSAIVNTYQALGGGVLSISTPADFHGQFPYTHTVRSGENFWTISLLYYRSGRYCKALWAANKNAVPAFDRLAVGDKIIIPRPDQLDPALIEEVPAPAPPLPETVPVDGPATLPPAPATTRRHAWPVRPEGDRRPRRQSHRRHQTPRGLAEAGDDGEVTGRFAHGMIEDGPRFVATCQLSGSPGSGWSGRRMRLRSTPTSRCDSTECLSGRSRCTS